MEDDLWGIYGCFLDAFTTSCLVPTHKFRKEVVRKLLVGEATLLDTKEGAPDENARRGF